MHDLERDGSILANFLAHATKAPCSKVFKPSRVCIAVVEKVFGSVATDGLKTNRPWDGSHVHIVKPRPQLAYGFKLLVVSISPLI